jgi:hypothetical protein
LPEGYDEYLDGDVPWALPRRLDASRDGLRELLHGEAALRQGGVEPLAD